MVEQNNYSLSVEDAEYEKKFTRENTWRNFKMMVYNGVGLAAFLGLLGNIANRLISASETMAPKALEAANAAFDAAVSTAQAAGTAVTVAPPPSTFFEAAFANATLTIPLMIGMAAVGILAAYASTSEGTEIKRLQDDRLARQNARAQERCKEQGICNDIEYLQNQRTDGKSWAASVAANENQRIHGAAR
jgi:hypothetical protein